MLHLPQENVVFPFTGNRRLVPNLQRYHYTFNQKLFYRPSKMTKMIARLEFYLAVKELDQGFNEKEN